MKFDFSIKEAIKKAWALFIMHPWFFAILSLVMLILNISSRGSRNIILEIVVVVAAVVWSYVWLSASLAAVDGHHDILKFSQLKQHFPSFGMLVKLICVGLLTALIVLVGLVLLIIPGIYFLTRLSFANLSLVDRKGSIRQSMRYSWYLVKGDVFWTVFLTLIISIAMIFIAALTVVGLFVVYPIALMMIAQLYRALSKREQVAVVEQPLEIPPSEEL